MMVKFLLLALVFGLAHVHAHDHAELQGQWKTTAIMADNIDKIETSGPMKLFVREITCDKGCQEMKVTFYVKQNGQCSLTTVTGYKQEDGKTFRNQYEGENNYKLLKATSGNLVFYDENVDRASRKTKLLYVLGKGEPLTHEQKETFTELATQKGIPAGNLKELAHEDTCPE
uniref:Lipocalin/cytosolic fatty-acid binding domain-containing protein n=1 Tax=Mus spicilegus TaxID=10103 RepID=A0A8C6GRI1_MUSSI